MNNLCATLAEQSAGVVFLLVKKGYIVNYQHDVENILNNFAIPMHKWA
jgi:hypothetical protein